MKRLFKIRKVLPKIALLLLLVLIGPTQSFAQQIFPLDPAPAAPAPTPSAKPAAIPSATPTTTSGKTVKSEECFAGTQQVPEAIAQNNQGFCNIVYTDGSKDLKDFSISTDATTSKDPKGNVTSTTISPAADTGGSCGILSLNLGDCLLNVLGTILIQISNWILGEAGVLLNWVTIRTVFQFSKLVGNSQGLLTSWGILRDLGNIALLFGFVFMGIATILDTTKFTAKKALPNLIIFAVLMNFSLFASEAVIDVSDVLSTVMYSQANTNPCTSDSCDQNNGIAGHIMQATGLSGIYKVTATDGTAAANKFIVIVGITLLSLVGAVVLFATAIMLAYRAVLLTGLIIVSPIGFAGMAIPPLSKMANSWWKSLVNQAFFAPVLLLLILVSLKVTETFSAGGENGSLAEALQKQDASAMGIIMVFVLIIAALIASLMAAQRMSAAGSGFAIKSAGNFAFGTAAFAGRHTVGRGSAFAARTIRSSAIGSSVFGRSLAGIADAGAKSSYDVRASKLTKTITKAAKIDLGAPDKTQSGGFAAIEKRDIDARTAHAKSFQMSDKQAETKTKLDAIKETETANNKKTQDELTNAKAPFLATKIEKETEETKIKTNQQKLKDNWKKRETDIDKEIAQHEATAQSNTDNNEEDRLVQAIAAEKLNNQRLGTTGTIQETLASNKKIQELEKAHAELGKTSEKIATLRTTKAQEFTEFNSSLNTLDAQLNTVTAEKSKAIKEIADIDTKIAAATSAHKDKIAEIDAELTSIDPKTRQEAYANTLQKTRYIGGRPNTQAARAIRANMKKTKTQSQADAIKEAMKSGDPVKIDEAIDGLPGAVAADAGKPDEAAK